MEGCLSGLGSLASQTTLCHAAGGDRCGDRHAGRAAATTKVGHAGHRSSGAEALTPCCATSCLDHPIRYERYTATTVSSSVPLGRVDTTGRSSTEAITRVRHPAGNDNLHERRDAGVPNSQPPPPPSPPLSVPPVAAALPPTPPPPGPVDAGGNVGNVSRAAVEAWTAAEAWAFTIASATSATVATTGAAIDAIVEGGASGRTETTAKGGTLELAEPRECFFISGRDQNNNRCSCEVVDCRLVDRRLLTPTVVSPTTEGCADNPAATVYNDGTAPFPTTMASTESGVHAAVDARSKLPRPRPPPPLYVHKNSQATGRKRTPFNSAGYSRSFLEAGWVAQFVPLRGAAAVVLQRIEHGEKVWRRHAMWTGMAMIRAHYLWVRELRAMENVAVNHHGRVCLGRGLRSMKARMEWVGRRRGAVSATAAAASAMADTFYRARRFRRGMIMIRRLACFAPRDATHVNFVDNFVVRADSDVFISCVPPAHGYPRVLLFNAVLFILQDNAILLRA